MTTRVLGATENYGSRRIRPSDRRHAERLLSSASDTFVEASRPRGGDQRAHSSVPRALAADHLDPAGIRSGFKRRLPRDA